MGGCQNGDLRVNFDRTLKLRSLGSKVTTDAGLLAYRELDEALGLTEIGADAVEDSRLGPNKQHALLPLLRQSIWSRRDRKRIGNWGKPRPPNAESCYSSLAEVWRTVSRRTKMAAGHRKSVSALHMRGAPW
jgi:hypothetical protein